MVQFPFFFSFGSVNVFMSAWGNDMGVYMLVATEEKPWLIWEFPKSGALTSTLDSRALIIRSSKKWNPNPRKQPF